MHEQAAPIFLKLLLDKFAPKRQEALLKLLPAEEAEAIRVHTTVHGEPDSILFRPTAWIKSLHPSWLAKPLEEIPSLQQPLRALFATQEPSVQQYPPLVKEFLLTVLHTHCTIEEPLPKVLIAHNPLEPLLHMNAQELMQVVDLLAVLDILEDVRQIIDKKVLKTLLGLLSAKQQQYVRESLRQKIRGTTPPFKVLDLLKEPKLFRKTLHKRGLEKFALAISGLDVDFLLNIYHTLDLKRAQFLMHLVEQELVPEQTNTMRLQILHSIQFLTQKVS